jgi:hypothetical protein
VLDDCTQMEAYLRTYGFEVEVVMEPSSD